MLYPLLSKYIGFPLLGYILNGLYFGLIIAGIVLSAFLFFKQMARTGYDTNRLRAFVICSVIMIVPLGVISSRVANMFYFPPDQWSLSFFIEQFFSGPHQTFHAALILPFIFLLLLGQWFKFEKIHLIDSLFLYIPLGHAFGRCGCFLVGCCWGNPVSFILFEKSVSFHNPVPLYSIIFNLLLFLFLRQMYHRIYVKRNNRNKRYLNPGMIAASYLMGYGGFRILVEFIRTEKVVGMGMTMAQWCMLFFMICGMVFLLQSGILIDMSKKTIYKGESDSAEDPSSVWAFMGFILSLLLVTGVVVFLLTRKLIPWPFHGADTVFDTYGRILVYLPFAGFSFLSVLWIKGNKRPVADYFTWTRFSFTFPVGLILSAGYSLYLFLTHNFVLKGLSFVPPAMMLGFLNAFSEELLFRLVFFQLLIPLTGSWQRANLMQAILYGFVHLFIGGPVFFLGAVGYGFLLGWITKLNKSILPAIICHFIADVGAIGLPLLILY